MINGVIKEVTDAPSVGGIYMIINSETGRKYYGKSKNIKRRLKGHLRRLGLGVHSNKQLQEDWHSHSFVFLVYRELDNDLERSRLEFELIMKNDGGYNAESPNRPQTTIKQSLQPRKNISWGTDRRYNPRNGFAYSDEEVDELMGVRND